MIYSLLFIEKGSEMVASVNRVLLGLDRTIYMHNNGFGIK